MLEYSKSKNDNNLPTYELNDMTGMSYAVEGGMEDWAYAGSWENNYSLIRPVKKCDPQTYIPYNINKTNYDDNSLRNHVYLVENANTKKPDHETLGIDDNLFDISKINIK